MELKINNIYYYGKRIVVEYLGKNNKGDHIFCSTNGGKQIIKEKDLDKYITE